MTHKKKKKLGIFIRLILSPVFIIYLVLVTIFNNNLGEHLNSVVVFMLALFLYLLTPLIKLGERNRYIYNTKNRIEKKLGTKKRILFKGPIEDFETTVSGSAGLGVIVLTPDLIKMYDTSPKIIDFFLGHEIAHYKFNDTENQREYRKLMKSSDNMTKNKASINHIITEIRADITSGLINEFSPNEYGEILRLANRLNAGESWEEEDRKISYDRGYPSRKERIEFPLQCIKLRELNKLNKCRIDDSVVIPLITDFCKVREINHQDTTILVDYALQEFWKEPVMQDILNY